MILDNFGSYSKIVFGALLGNFHKTSRLCNFLKFGRSFSPTHLFKFKNYRDNYYPNFIRMKGVAEDSLISLGLSVKWKLANFKAFFRKALKSYILPEFIQFFFGNKSFALRLRLQFLFVMKYLLNFSGSNRKYNLKQNYVKLNEFTKFENKKFQNKKIKSNFGNKVKTFSYKSRTSLKFNSPYSFKSRRTFCILKKKKHFGGKKHFFLSSVLRKKKFNKIILNDPVTKFLNLKIKKFNKSFNLKYLSNVIYKFPRSYKRYILFRFTKILRKKNLSFRIQKLIWKRIFKRKKTLNLKSFYFFDRLHLPVLRTFVLECFNEFSIFNYFSKHSKAKSLKIIFFRYLDNLLKMFKLMFIKINLY